MDRAKARQVAGGIAIRIFRQVRGIEYQKDLARRCGWPPARISRYERGRALPGKKSRQKIAQVLDIRSELLDHAIDTLERQIRTLARQADDPEVPAAVAALLETGGEPEADGASGPDDRSDAELLAAFDGCAAAMEPILGPEGRRRVLRLLDAGRDRLGRRWNDGERGEGEDRLPF